MMHELIRDHLTFGEVPLSVELHKNLHGVVEAINLVEECPIHVLKIRLIRLKGPQILQLRLK